MEIGPEESKLQLEIVGVGLGVYLYDCNKQIQIYEIR